MEKNCITVANDAGRLFTVRIVTMGQRYGLADCIVHNEADKPLIEFYDATYAGPAHGPRGQFVSRYYAANLRARRDDEYSLSLQGSEPDWTVSARNVREALDYCDRITNPPGQAQGDSAQWEVLANEAIRDAAEWKARARKAEHALETIREALK